MKQKGISEIFVKLNIELIRNVHFLKKNLYDARLLLSKEKKRGQLLVIFRFLDRTWVYEIFFSSSR